MADRVISIIFGREGDDDSSRTAHSLGSLGHRAGGHRGTDVDAAAAESLASLLRERERIQRAIEHCVDGRWYASDWRGSKRVRDLSDWSPNTWLRAQAEAALREYPC